MTKQEIRDKIDNYQNDEELMIILKKFNLWINILENKLPKILCYLPQ